MTRTIDFYLGEKSHALFEGKEFELGKISEIKLIQENQQVQVFYKNNREFKKVSVDLEHFIQKVENKVKILAQESYISPEGFYSKYLSSVGFVINLNKTDKCNITYLIE